MGSYITNFIVYTLAMSGLIVFALFIYKKVMSGSFCSNKSSSMEIEETLSISPRKSLMIIRVGNERFLVASDMDKTSLISKLESGEKIKDTIKFDKEFKEEKNKVEEIIPQNVNYVEFNPDKTEEPIHLELIKGPNKKSSGRKKVVSKKDSKLNVKTKARIDTMKKMAKKINEL